VVNGDVSARAEGASPEEARKVVPSFIAAGGRKTRE
jgi:hypothetical protein